ncbi:hypothetical protein TIFTF001_021863 [Ficus carica]|uniref:Uncharacterized protein n=1 Tax=Ficus carica TaxID=3494 RepID=A0AA88AGQ1_FICCA|nr:hypothetical protein TIFTF001_021863 [Ficus carica]
MADQWQRGPKHPNDQKRAAWMQRKFGKGNDGNKTLPRGQGSNSMSRGSVDPLAVKPKRIRDEHPSSTDHFTKARTLSLVVFLTFSDNAAAWCYSLHMDNKVAGLVTDFKKWKDAEKVRKYVVADYKIALEFEARLFSEYKNDMRDIKPSFTLANPNLTGLDWFFMPKISWETQVGDGDGTVVDYYEKGEVVEDVWVAKELEVILEPGVIEQDDA